MPLQDDLAERIVNTGAPGVLIDISAVEIVDSFIGRMFASMAALSRVLDAETVVVGMRPAVPSRWSSSGSLQGSAHRAHCRGLDILRQRAEQRGPRLATEKDVPLDEAGQDNGWVRLELPESSTEPGRVEDLPIRTGDDVVRVANSSGSARRLFACRWSTKPS